MHAECGERKMGTIGILLLVALVLYLFSDDGAQGIRA
jgi:hypothetical protein